MVVLGNEALIGGRVVLHWVHPPSACAGRACVLHNPSDHPMRSWPLRWRDDRGLFERICEHSCGHPDPDQRDFWREIGAEWMGVHGCCGCCAAL